MVRRVEVDRAGLALFGGRADLVGTVAFPGGLSAPVQALRGTLKARNFPIMIQQMLAARLLAPEQATPLVLLAGSLGRLAQDGTLIFDARSTADGGIILNDRPTALKLPR